MKYSDIEIPRAQGPLSKIDQESLDRMESFYKERRTDALKSGTAFVVSAIGGIVEAMHGSSWSIPTLLFSASSFVAAQKNLCQLSDKIDIPATREMMILHPEFPIGLSPPREHERKEKKARPFAFAGASL